MDHSSRFYDVKHYGHQYNYAQQAYRDFNNLSYWNLLYRVALIAVGLFSLICLIMHQWLPHSSYLHLVDITALIVVPFIMLELSLRRYKYRNTHWNQMILLASFIIGISSLSAFY